MKKETSVSSGSAAVLTQCAAVITQSALASGLSGWMLLGASHVEPHKKPAEE